MIFTSKLGTSNSKLGQFKLATIGGPPPISDTLILNSTPAFVIGSIDSLVISNNSNLTIGVFTGVAGRISLSSTTGFFESFIYSQNLSAVTLSSHAQLSVYQGITDFIIFPSVGGMLYQSEISNATAVNLISTGNFSVSSSPTTFEGIVIIPGTSQFILAAGLISSATLTLANASSGFSSVNELSISLPAITSTAGLTVDFIYSPGGLVTFVVHPGMAVDLIYISAGGGTAETNHATAGFLFDATIVSGHLTNNTLIFTQTAIGIRQVFANNTLIFNQTAVGGRLISRSVNTIFTLTQVLAKTAIYNRTVTNQLKFNTYFSKQTTFGVFNIPQGIGTVVQKIATVRLSVPGRLIILRAPVFGDTQNYTNSVSVKRCIQGDYFTYIKKPDTQVLKYSFEMGRIKSLELRDFLFNFSDKVIKLENWRGETWIGNIVNNPFVFIAKNRYFNDREQIDLTLEFEGIQIL